MVNKSANVSLGIGLGDIKTEEKSFQNQVEMHSFTLVQPLMV